jgi:predicted TIM-barrel fold metal-dependent hydrolase
MIIDCDTHIIPRDAFDYVEEEFTNLKPVFHFDEKGHYWYCDFPGKPPEVPGTTPLPGIRGAGTDVDGMCDMEARLRDYEKLGVDLQVLGPQFTGWWSYLIEPALADAVAHSHNLAVLKIMRQYPSKFIGTALVALQDVQGAMREMEWAYDNGFKTVILDYTYPVREHPFGETLGSRRELWPFFKRAEELGQPVLLHAVQHGHRLVNALKFQKEGLDFLAPHDGHMNLVSMITSGLLDDFPELKFIHTESGTAWIKPLLQRMDRSFERPPVNYDDENPTPRGRRRVQERAKQVVPPEVSSEKNKLPPSHYFRKNFYFTIETEEPELPQAIEFLGAKHFLFATDYPHDDPGGRMKFKDAELLRSNNKISESDKELIRWKNAERLFGLSLASER